MITLNRKNLVLGGAFLGVFTLGAMFTPIGQPTATGNDPNSALPLAQTATEKAPDGDICQMTGEPMGQGMMGGMKGGMMAGMLTAPMHDTVAKELGMTADELKTAINDGRTIADLAKEKGVNIDKLLAKLVESRKANLEQLVKDGKIKQEQMDAMLERMGTMMKSAVEGKSMGMMNGRGKGKMCNANGGAGQEAMANQLID
jgi:hypothetical protein